MRHIFNFNGISIFYCRANRPIVIPLETGERALCSVKSGKVNVSYVRELQGLLNDKRDVAGVFISRKESKRDMKDFVDKAGLHRPQKLLYPPFPRMQILTLQEILNVKRPSLPHEMAA